MAADAPDTAPKEKEQTQNESQPEQQEKEEVQPEKPQEESVSLLCCNIAMEEHDKSN